jgi:hypothetical protein
MKWRRTTDVLHTLFYLLSFCLPRLRIMEDSLDLTHNKLSEYQTIPVMNIVTRLEF